MRRRHLLAVAAFLAGLASGGSAAGGDPETPQPTAEPGSPEGCAEGVAARVQAYYDGVRDLRAGFRQSTRSAVFGGASGLEQPAAGTVEFAKPGRMRWIYTEPEPSEVVSDGSTLWIYDPIAREVQVLQVGEAFLSAAAIQFLLGSGRILETFRVAADDCEAASVYLVLTPLQASSYERLEMEVDRDSGVIARTVVLDVLGNRTEVAFDDVAVNQDPEPARFVFQVPEGVRELRLDAP